MAENNKLNNARIYRIVSNVTGENYYGSTCEPTLARRLAKHRNNYKRYLQGKHKYTTSYKILETNDYEIVLVEKLDNCQSKDELHKRERYYIENNECVNKAIPTRTFKEYYHDNKEKIQQYRVDNKEKLQEYQKEYRNDNIDKIQQYQKLTYFCQCSSIVKLCNKARHNKTNFHKNHIEKEKQLFENIFYCDSIFKKPMTYPEFNEIFI